MTTKTKIPLAFTLGTALGALLLFFTLTGSAFSSASEAPQAIPGLSPQGSPTLQRENSRFEVTPQARAKTAAKPKAEQQIGKLVRFTPPPLNDFSGLNLPRSRAERMVLTTTTSAMGDGQLELDEKRRDALTGLGLCTRWIVKCVEPGSRSLDDCARSAPTCTKDKPWLNNEQCCPAECFQQYAALRIQGEASIATFDHVYFTNASCFPGVQDLLGHP